VAVKRSAGILLHRRRGGDLEVLLVHPGGPFWAKKDHGSWSVPKGEYEEAEEPLACALRELREELGEPPELTADDLLDIGEVQQRAGKLVRAWAAEADFDPARLRSNTFAMEWPPRSGKEREFPEVDRARWFALEEAAERILPGQLPFLERLQRALGRHG
jgi:predicted NUDIX family NTP pyrophosphohydrolase